MTDSPERFWVTRSCEVRSVRVLSFSRNTHSLPHLLKRINKYSKRAFKWTAALPALTTIRWGRPQAMQRSHLRATLESKVARDGHPLSHSHCACIMGNLMSAILPLLHDTRTFVSHATSDSSGHCTELHHPYILQPIIRLSLSDYPAPLALSLCIKACYVWNEQLDRGWFITYHVLTIVS